MLPLIKKYFMNKKEEKRDIPKELKEIIERNKDNRPGSILSRIVELKNSLDNLKIDENEDSEIFKYVPVALVATAESLCKQFVKELIDIGNPYLRNANNLSRVQNVKIDLKILSETNNKFFTIGDFIAHFLSFNNINDIDDIFSEILGCKFLSEIKQFKTPFDIEDEDKKIEYQSIHNEFQTYMVRNSDKVIKSVIDTYKLRHIICHESAFGIKINKIDANNLILNFGTFLECLDSYLDYNINPELSVVPYYNQALKKYSWNKFSKFEDELDTIIKIIEKKILDYEVDYDMNLFRTAIENWREYRSNISDSAAKSWEGGTGQGLIVSSELGEETEFFIQHLKRKFKIY
jgi:hypothetical protein